MEIMARQYGRLEMAAWALAKHSEHNEVCTVLANGIMEVLDEIAAEDDLGELGREIPEICDVIGDGEREPDVPDWRENANLDGPTFAKAVADMRRGNRSGDAIIRRSESDGEHGSAGGDGAAQFAEEDELTRIRLIVAAHQGESLAAIIRAIQKETGLNSRELAGVLGVNPGRISEAVHGKAKPCFKERFTEVLGEGADFAKKKAGKRGAK